MAYNMTWTNSTTNIYQAFYEINLNLNGFPGLAILFLILLLSYNMMPSSATTANKFVSSTFITLILSVLFWAASLIQWWVVVFILALFIGALLVSIFE